MSQCPGPCPRQWSRSSQNTRFRPLQLPTPVPPLVGSFGSIARQKAASGQPRIEMVCSACAACELWWGIAGLNGFQGSKFICQELWGAEAPGACPSSVGRCGKRPTGAKFDQSETHPMPSQAARPNTAVLLDSHTQASRLQLCAVRTQGCTPPARSGRWLHVHSTGPGLGPRQLCQPSLSRPEPTFHPLCSVIVCLTVCVPA